MMAAVRKPNRDSISRGSLGYRPSSDDLILVEQQGALTSASFNAETRCSQIFNICCTPVF
jgi:hypothetical protein